MKKNLKMYYLLRVIIVLLISAITSISKILVNDTITPLYIVMIVLVLILAFIALQLTTIYYEDKK